MVRRNPERPRLTPTRLIVPRLAPDEPRRCAFWPFDMLVLDLRTPNAIYTALPGSDEPRRCASWLWTDQAAADAISLNR
ncbi:hypothetical protein Acr_00g0029900 [Actinidia rufa]|uniref:Uncharacterized protein n=1 Tax=Actinidia rufa TaxID=165716 RepID=A0A7J0DEX1_9ERIC|nr:hypothetical protein Acr_00g0029900 [Actinidia rufa]